MQLLYQCFFSKSRHLVVQNTESHLRLVLCLLVVQLCGHLFQTVKNPLTNTQGRQALQLHYLWKELQLGGRPQNSYRLPRHKDGKPFNCTICGKSFLWADALRTHIGCPAKTQGRQAPQLHYLWKELQLGGRPQKSYWPPSVDRKTSLENTPFSLWIFS